MHSNKLTGVSEVMPFCVPVGTSLVLGLVAFDAIDAQVLHSGCWATEFGE